MKLIFGLGNPDEKYAGTRHNAGFFAVDGFAKLHHATFTEKAKLKAFVAELSVEGEKVLLAKPVTFYNLVGESYRAIIDFYKIAPEDTLVVHDELALPFGTTRARFGGSDAGNNGVKSINQHGGEASARLRIGISSEYRNVVGDTDFVLGKFTKAEEEKLTEQLPRIIALLERFSDGTFESTTHAASA